MTLYFKGTSTAEDIPNQTGEEYVEETKRIVQKNNNNALAIKMISKMASIPTAVVVTDAGISSVPTMSRVHTGKVLIAAQVTNMTTVQKASIGSKEVRRRTGSIRRGFLKPKNQNFKFRHTVIFRKDFFWRMFLLFRKHIWLCQFF